MNDIHTASTLHILKLYNRFFNIQMKQNNTNKFELKKKKRE